jgi:hypothetical protein
VGTQRPHTAAGEVIVTGAGPGDGRYRDGAGRRPWVISSALLAVALVGGGAAVAVAWPRGPATPALSGHTVPTTTSTSTPAATGPIGGATAALACGDQTGGTAPGSVVTTTASLGGVSATATGTLGSGPSGPFLENASITIQAGGATLVRAPLTKPAQAFDLQLAGLMGSPATTMPLCVARFPGEHTPTVLLGLFTGGAHCCSVVRAWPATRGAEPVDDNVGNGGVDAAQTPGGAELVTTDNAFYYSFASFAASGAPVLVQSFAGGRFVNVTPQHLDLVRLDADRWLAAFYETLVPSPNSLGGLGVLAAWAGDECTLAVPGEPWATLAKFQAQGELTGPPGAGPTGQAFVDQLRTFLSQHGYCTSG